MSSFRLPDDSQRITIIGKTGSGKTQGAAWMLSNRSYTTKPWIILDFKRDDLLNQIPHLQEMKVDAAIPKKAGIYIVHPNPDEVDAVESLLWRIWERENVGLFIDEGYMIPSRSAAFQSILTQGRSKRIPVIMLTQRPTWVTRFAFSEADFIQLYKLTDERDQKTVKQFMPLPIERPLPKDYYSFWWDNGRNYRAVMSPVPDQDVILATFYERGRKRKGIF